MKNNNRGLRIAAAVLSFVAAAYYTFGFFNGLQSLGNRYHNDLLGVALYVVSQLSFAAAYIILGLCVIRQDGKIAFLSTAATDVAFLFRINSLKQERKTFFSGSNCSRCRLSASVNFQFIWRLWLLFHSGHS